MISSAYGMYCCMMKEFTVVDRKSTRLNSSHVKISYAVFCLKKKEAQQVLYTPKAAAGQDPPFGRFGHCRLSFLFAGRCNFFFNDTATTEIYTLSLHDALPISV